MSAEGGPPASVVLRPVGSSLAMGMTGLAVASLVAAGHALGWVPLSDTHQVGLLLLVTVVPLQAIGATFALLARDGAAAGAMGLMAATWAATGAARLTSVPGVPSHALGLAMLAGGVLIVASAAIKAPSKPIPSAAITLAGAHFVLTALYELGAGTGLKDAGGVVGVATCVVAGVAALSVDLHERATGRLADEPGVCAQL